MTNKSLSDKISRGRTRIILRDPFFATILMDMDPEIDADVTETCATDGERVIFNPAWLAETEDRLVAAAMRKMALHVALSHHLRRGPHRDPRPLARRLRSGRPAHHDRRRHGPAPRRDAQPHVRGHDRRRNLPAP
jgi:hypothetical protein